MQKLFIYGTLRDPLVQQAVLGRTTPGTPAVIGSYGRFEIVLETGIYPIIRPQAGAEVHGLLIEVTAEELSILDVYETDAYQRIRVILRSGVEAWVYAQPGV